MPYNNKSIQILRGSSNSEVKLQEGQPFYNRTDHSLRIGQLGGNTSIANTPKIVAGALLMDQVDIKSYQSDFPVGVYSVEENSKKNIVIKADDDAHIELKSPLKTIGINNNNSGIANVGSITGATSISATSLTTTGNVSVGGNLVATSIVGNISISGTLGVGSSTSITGNTTIGGTLTATNFGNLLPNTSSNNIGSNTTTGRWYLYSRGIDNTGSAISTNSLTTNSISSSGSYISVVNSLIPSSSNSIVNGSEANRWRAINTGALNVSSISGRSSSDFTTGTWSIHEDGEITTGGIIQSNKSPGYVSDFTKDRGVVRVQNQAGIGTDPSNGSFGLCFWNYTTAGSHSGGAIVPYDHGNGGGHPVDLGCSSSPFGTLYLEETDKVVSNNLISLGNHPGVYIVWGQCRYMDGYNTTHDYIQVVSTSSGSRYTYVTTNYMLESYATGSGNNIDYKIGIRESSAAATGYFTITGYCPLVLFK